MVTKDWKCELCHCNKAMFKGVTRKEKKNLLGNYSKATRKLLESYSKATRKLLESYSKATRELREDNVNIGYIYFFLNLYINVKEAI